MSNFSNKKTNRPRYETEEHLQKEREFADVLANKWSCYIWEKADINTGFDYWVYNDERKVKAICEIKCRNTFSTTYVSIMISKSKFENIRTLCDMWGSEIVSDGTKLGVKVLPVIGIFAFRFLDGDFYYRYSKPELEEQVSKKLVWDEEKGGRTKQTRDKWDIEDMVHISRDLLIPIDVKFKSGIAHGRRTRKLCEYTKRDYEIKG